MAPKIKIRRVNVTVVAQPRLIEDPPKGLPRNPDTKIKPTHTRQEREKDLPWWAR